MKKFDIKITIEAEDEEAVENAVKSIPGFVDIVAGPEDSEDFDDIETEEDLSDEGDPKE